MALSPAWQAFREARLEDAVRLARAAVAGDGADDGEAWFTLGCCLERAGDLIGADRAFRRAAVAAVDPCGPPCRVAFARFRAMVEGVAAELPPPVRAAYAEVTLVVADWAEPWQLDGFPDVAELLGQFSGPPRAERLHAPPGELSPCIHVFRRAHEHACADLDELAAEARRTVLHELGHYLGYDEHGLEGLDLD